MKLLFQALSVAAGLLPHSTASRPSGSSFGIPGMDAAYDYVVVGGGTAGLTIASRLVEQKAGSVAVIEAGTFYELSTGNITQVPATSATWAGKSPTDWQPLADWGYVTAPQEGANGIQIHYPQGKMLGGSSARNTLVYHRGTRSSYQKWADLVGDEGYTFENLLPYFQKSLNFTPPNNDLRLSNATPDYDDSALGTGDGPLRLSFSNWAYAFGTWATKAFSEIGISIRKEGFQNGGLLGQAYSMSTQDGVTMLRSSSETAFLRRSLGDTEFYVYPLTLARKVLFERKSQTTGKMAATGVLVETSGAQYRISAKKEVIISAGVFGSPKLLQISGIGPSALLEGLDIPVVVDLPGVGQNMQDQVYVSISHSINAITASSLGDPLFLSQQTRLFNDEGAGLLASTGLDIIAWEKLPRGPSSCLDNETTQYLDTFPDDWPEVEYLAFSAYFGDVSLPVTADTHGGTQYASVGVALAASRSIGSVNITSADASVAPSIDPRYFAEKADMDVAVAGFKRARQFWASNSLRGFVASNEAYPGSSVGDDYESIQASIRQSFMTAYHGSCTCAMGKPSDPRAVVDTQARVFNVDGLRVVDASIFPLLPPGHPQATVYALAEKIACNISGNC